MESLLAFGLRAWMQVADISVSGPVLALLPDTQALEVCCSVQSLGFEVLREEVQSNPR